MRRKKDSEHVNHERWLVSYADFITLLFAFFVVLYASSQVDKRRVGQLALAIQVAFQQMGIFDASNAKPQLADSEPMPFSNVQMIDNATRLSTIAQIASPPRGAPAGSPQREDMKKLQQELETQLGPEIKNHEVAISQTREGLVVSLREIGFFSSGSSGVLINSLPTLDHLAAAIAPHDLHIRIEGHTDDVPIHNGRFSSNWELSTSRATEMIKLFIVRYRFAPERLSASGYAEYHPVASNDTPEGRAKNRRVDIVILNPPDRQTGAPLQPNSAAFPSASSAPPLSTTLPARKQN
jgi:chemotaxis protein MotB